VLSGLPSRRLLLLLLLLLRVSAAGLWCMVCQEVLCWDLHAACGIVLA
jgi:hypothetical protein